MSDTKRDVMEALTELAELTALDEGSKQAFRVRAYENAKRAIEAHSGDLAGMTQAQLTKLDGIGKSTAQKIKQLIDSGRIDKLDALREKYPPAIVAVSQIPGIGPKAVQKLRSELGIQSVDDLRQALANKQVRELDGFGEKSEQKIAKAIERLGLTGKDQRTPIYKAMPVAEKLVAAFAALPGVEQAAYCGSLRRMRETIGDLDIVVASREPAPIMEHLVSQPFVHQVLVRGDKKTSVVSNKGMQIDVRVVAPEQIGAAMLYFTGSKAHNIKLRQRAMDRGWLLNEYALEEQDGGKVVAQETEAAIYAALDLPFIPPVLREDNGEIEAAEESRLPAALSLDQVNGDLHVHTKLSGDGRSPLEDVVEAARERGYSFLAITEHAEDLPMQGVLREALVEQRERLRSYPADDIALLHGVELNIGPEGELDYDHDFRMSFDWCLASVHTHFDLSREQQTRRIIKAMEDPSVNMIGHLSARMIGKRPGIELDLDAVLAAAARTRTALEINSALPRLDVDLEVLRRARQYPEVVFILTSDAHHHSELSRMQWGTQHALRGWLEPERIANSWTRERFVAWARDQRATA